jgi:acylphosphatase
VTSDRSVDRSVDVHVTGRVQGVSFRWYAASEAARLGLAGWIRNEPDGSVRAHAEGPADSVDQFVAWCRQGPPAARVDDVAVTEVEGTAATSFDITP